MSQVILASQSRIRGDLLRAAGVDIGIGVVAQLAVDHAVAAHLDQAVG